MHSYTFSDTMKWCSEYIGINTVSGTASSWNDSYRQAKDSGFDSPKNFVVIDPANCWVLANELRSTPEKVAKRLGANDAVAQAIGVACKVTFHVSEASILFAVKKVGSSCMSSDYQKYRYYTRATNARFAVVSYMETRCLVRMDTMSYIVAYGKQHTLLTNALRLLGYSQDECWIRENTELEVVFPSSIREYRVWPYGVSSFKQVNPPFFDFYYKKGGGVKIKTKLYKTKVNLPK